MSKVVIVKMSTLVKNDNWVADNYCGKTTTEDRQIENAKKSIVEAEARLKTAEKKKKAILEKQKKMVEDGEIKPLN